jgi:hypothetical protein
MKKTSSELCLFDANLSASIDFRASVNLGKQGNQGGGGATI